MNAVRGTSFRAIGTTHRVLATDPTALHTATAIALAHLAELDRAASRFRADSEVSRLAELARHGPVVAAVSDLLAEHVRAALRAARLTDGLVDPTVGAALVAEGYDADLAVVQRRRPTDLPAYAAATAARVPGWRSVRLDPTTGDLHVAAGTLLDLGASAKAHAADRIAAMLAERLPGGFLVDLGGDLAFSGRPPLGGWRVAVGSGAPPQVVVGHGQAFATSSSRRRSWRAADGVRHHVVDPRTGRSARTPWAQVTCAAATALEANAAATAALVLGDAAPAWLERHGVPTRLDAHDGSLVTVAGWPRPGGVAPLRAMAVPAA